MLKSNHINKNSLSGHVVLFKEVYMKKLFFAMSFAFALSAMSIIVSAQGSGGSWRKNDIGWWHETPDGGYYSNVWFQDSDSKWYYFNGDGYMVADQWVGDYYLSYRGAMLTNTITPDGYAVDYNGKWIHAGSNGRVGDTDLDNGTYTFDLTVDGKEMGVDYCGIYGNQYLIAGHIYRESDNEYVEYRSLSYKLTGNTRYRTKYGMSGSVDVSREQFVEFSNDYSAHCLLTITVVNGDVADIMLYKLR
jgi:pneumococcal surface protein A